MGYIRPPGPFSHHIKVNSDFGTLCIFSQYPPHDRIQSLSLPDSLSWTLRGPVFYLQRRVILSRSLNGGSGKKRDKPRVT